jgi:hypothetical protein
VPKDPPQITTRPRATPTSVKAAGPAGFRFHDVGHSHLTAWNLCLRITGSSSTGHGGVNSSRRSCLPPRSHGRPDWTDRAGMTRDVTVS